MADKVTLRLSAAAAAYVNKDAPRETRLKAARGDVALSATDLGTVLFFLGHDPDPEVKGAAINSLRNLPEAQLLAMAEAPDTHPKILDILARLHHAKKAVAKKLASHPLLESRTLAFLAGMGVEEAVSASPADVTVDTEKESADAATDDDEVNAESEEFLTKYNLSMKMEISEKIKMALIGDKEWRTLMLKDTVNLVSEAVLKNPRITEPEVLAVASSTAYNEEMLRIICRNREWLKNYKIRKALVQNCKTPLPTAIRLLTTLNEKDLGTLAKSKNIPTVLSTQARKMVLNKKRD